MEVGEQCDIENGKSEETDDVPNQSLSSDSTSDDAEELLGACAASGQERIERSQYNLCDEEMKTSLSGTSTNVQTEITPWPSQDTIQDVTTAVVGGSSSDSYLGLDQHVAEARANREQLQGEREEREQFRRELERKGLSIREQRVRQRMDQKERVEPQQQESHTADSQYTYSGTVS